MPRYTFEPRYPDGSPRLFAGTFRPPREEVEQSAGFIPTYAQQLGDAIAAGRYDRPLYHLDDDEHP